MSLTASGTTRPDPVRCSPGPARPSAPKSDPARGAHAAGCFRSPRAGAGAGAGAVIRPDEGAAISMPAAARDYELRRCRSRPRRILISHNARRKTTGRRAAAAHRKNTPPAPREIAETALPPPPPPLRKLPENGPSR